MNIVLDVLERFQLDLITDEWIKSRNFESDTADVPTQYADFLKSVDLSPLLEEVNNIVKPLLVNLEKHGISWDGLVEGKARPKALVCLLNHIVTKAFVCNFQGTQYLQGMQAAQFYFLMLAIPNSNVFCVFSSDLYSKCLQLINMAGTVKLSSDKQSHIGLIKALSLTLRVGNLSFNDECMDTTVLALSELTRLKPSSLSNHSVCSIAFDMLKSLCGDNYRNVEYTVSCILQRLFPNFLLGTCQDSDLSNREVSYLHGQTVIFISQLIMSIPPDSVEPFTILIKKMCTVSNERSDCRQKICDLVIKLLRSYPVSAVSELLKFVLKLTYDESAGYRLFAVELLGCILQENVCEMFNETVSSQSSFESGNAGSSTEIPPYYLLYSLFSRISDNAVSVRTRALSVLTICLKSHNQKLQQAVSDIFVVPFLSEEVPSEDALFVLMDFHHFLKKLDCNDTLIRPQQLLGGKAIVEKVIDRCLDSKVFVRRSAIQLLARIVALGRHWINEENILALSSHCRDTSTSVRKSSVEHLTELLLEYPDEILVCDAWIQNVLPLVEDNETTVSEKALESMEQVILKNMVEFARLKSPEDKLPWKIMSSLGRLQVRKFFSKACQVWGEKSVLKNYGLLKILTSHIGTENNISAWNMMASMADYLSIKDSEQFLEYFYNYIYKNATVDHRLSQLVIEVLALSCNALPLNKQEKLLTELESEMISFALPVTILPKCIEIMQTLSLSIACIKRGSAHDGQVCMSPAWAVRIAQISEKFIDGSLQSHEPVIANEEIFVRAVVSLGETSLLAPSVIKTQTVEQLGRVIDPSSDHVPECSATVKAGIVVTLGKWSLQCERIAKSMVAVFGRLLSSTDNSDIKSNVIIALADLTIRYTALVEDLLPEMCLCLKDRVRLVRENTLVLLTRLIQEDYLKMRSALLFHLLSALTDEDETIRAMTSSFFVDSALLKYKHLFQNHILECLFYFNGSLNHEHCQITVTERERKAFSLQGKRNQQKRESIYRFMLSQMDIQQRFKSQRMIVDCICGAAVEEGWKLDSSAQDVLRDALFCLLTEESRIIPSPGENDDEVAADVDDAAHQALHTAKAMFISEVVRGYVIGSELPIIVNLQQKLSKLNSPLAKDVMKFLHYQVQEYKADIGEIFKNDPDLSKTVLADMRRYEKENRISRSDSEGCDSAISSTPHLPEEDDAERSLREEVLRPGRSSKSGTTPQKPPRKRSLKSSDRPRHDSFSPPLLPEEDVAERSLREEDLTPRRSSKSGTTPQKSPRKRSRKSPDRPHHGSSQSFSSSWADKSFSSSRSSTILSSEALRTLKKPQQKTKRRFLLD